MLITGKVQTLYTVLLICTSESKHSQTTVQRDGNAGPLILAQNNFYMQHRHGGEQIEWLKHRIDVKQHWV